MSAQSFSTQNQNLLTAQDPLTEQNPLTTVDVTEHKGRQSVLDEPWKITLLAAPAEEEPQARRSLPWRRGDVTRLKDDTPEGMMRYIATHTTGWWQEMAERALRDTEKARQKAEEEGCQQGQYWSLEVDADAREKLLAAEEARWVREEAERAREQAEKEAFARRQMELLEKAGRAPRCEYVYADGRGCRAPQVKGEHWCHGHAKTMSYRPEKLELLPMEDEQAVMVNLHRVTKSLLSGRIAEKMARLMLWSVAIGAPGAGRIAPRKPDTHHGGTETRRKTARRADGRTSGMKFGSKLTRSNANGQINPGVNDGKSFRSGMDAGVPHMVIGTSTEANSHEGTARTW
jgi:hypothetical protein